MITTIIVANVGTQFNTNLQYSRSEGKSTADIVHEQGTNKGKAP
jgi:hypothetical protein